MTMMINQRGRGLVGVRADAGNSAEILAELQKAFEAFKTEHTAELKAKFADVVQTEKVDRINAEIGTLQKTIDDLNARLEAMNVGGGASNGETPEAKAHAKAFDRYFRKGIDTDLRDLEIKASLTTQSDPDGGYVVPSEMESQIDRVLGQMSAMRSMATVRRISAVSYKKLVNQGGAQSGWVEEEESRPETDTPTLRGLEFPTKELYANPGVTQRALDDAVMDLAGWLSDEVQIEFAEQEGSSFISGTGLHSPRGILSYDTIANASYTWGKLGFIVTGAAANFAASDPGDAFMDVIYGLKRAYRQNARWILNDTVFGAVRKFKDGEVNYLWQPSFQLGEPAQIAGYGVETDDNMPDVGANAFPVGFGDFRRGYLIIDRAGIRVLRDPYTNKPNVMFYTTKRVGGGVQNFEAIKLMKCST